MKIYKWHPTQSNLIFFKAVAARSRQINRRTRRHYFRNYTCTVRSTITLHSVYKVVHKILPKNFVDAPIVLKHRPHPSDAITFPGAVADNLWLHLQRTFSLGKHVSTVFELFCCWNRCLQSLVYFSGISSDFFSWQGCTTGPRWLLLLEVGDFAEVSFTVSEWLLFSSPPLFSILFLRSLMTNRSFRVRSSSVFS